MAARKRPVLVVSLLLTLGLVLLFAAVSLWRGPARQSSGEAVWFEDIQQPLSMAAADEEALARAVAAALLRRDGTQVNLPPALQQDDRPRIVFLSVSDGTTPARVLRGAGLGLAKALAGAVAQARAGGAGQPETAYQTAWVKVDIVQEVTRLEHVAVAQPLSFERSLYGLAFDRQSGIALLPEELVTYTLVDSAQNIELETMQAYLARRSLAAPGFRWPQPGEQVTLYRFTTASVFSDGQDSVGLYRGHRRFDQVSRDDILQAARRGGQYLAAAVGPDGKFIYSYRPKTDEVAAGYNILRHSGTIYAMLELYDFTKDPTLLQAAQRAIGYLLGVIKPCSTSKGAAACVVEEGEVKLGGNALAVIALAKYATATGDRQYLPVMRELSRWIQSTQAPSGEFTIHKQAYQEGQVDDLVSVYYPGEAMLALVRLYALDRDATWLDTVEASARYLINVRDGDLPAAALPHDHWLLYALNELYRYRPNPLYLQQTLRLAATIIKSQNDGAAYPDWAGGFYQPPRSTPAATRLEGLGAAYALARDSGYRQEAEVILDAMWRAAAFQLRTQFGPESAMYVTNPQRVLGGFHDSLTDFEIRIDYVQHNISSLLGLYRVTADKK